MRRALELAARARGDTAPNPMVGAVVVDANGTVVGEGWHRAAGEAHAEVVALGEAGDLAQGATLYVTLEPCTHHGLTPPCVDAVVAAGIDRVVIAQHDPDQRVSGTSLDILAAAGIVVVEDVCRHQAEAQLHAYRHHRSTGRPLVVLKAAATIDGATAAPDGSSQWITGEEARADAHELRRESDAVLVGSGTILADDPRLDVRTAPPPRCQPLRVVADARGRTPATAALFGTYGTVVMATTAAGAVRGAAAWEDAGAEMLVVGPGPGDGGGPGAGIDLDELVSRLGERGVLQVMVEGGAMLAGAVLRAGLVDRLVVYVGAATAGGDDAASVFGGPAATTVDAFARWRLDDITRLGDDVRLDYLPA